jgi:hypothetical protein
MRAVLAALLMAASVACRTAGPDDGAAGPGPAAHADLDSGSSEPQGTIVSPAPGGEPLTGAGTGTTIRSTRRPPRPPATTLADQLGEDVTAGRLVVPPPPPAAGTWGFIAQGADGPVSFDACRPIHYRIRLGPGPAGGEALVAEAIARVEAATGLRFAYDGTVDAAPTSGSFPAPNASVTLSESFAPVVIGWADREETDLWASEGHDTLGVGGPRTIVFDDDEKLSVSGFALLTPNDTLRVGFGPGLTAGNVLLHELGHVVGLDHVSDPAELMQARLDRNAPDGYGPGDRRGLWELGSSRGCASAYLHP